mgnify:CR=1 FL=1
MWNLLKNVFRSLAKNKIAIIGLTFLIFLSVGMFTVLQSTTTNINNTYDKVSTQGNQHDFTVSEKYDIGNIKFSPGSKIEGEGVGYSKEGDEVYWPNQQELSTSIYLKTYYLKLDASLDGDSAIDKFYKQYHNNPDYQEYFYRTIKVTNSNKLTYMENAQPGNKSTFSSADIHQQLSDAKHSGADSDIAKINAALSEWSTDLNNYLSEYNSPLNDYLSNDLKNQVYFRNFRSLKINNSTDTVYYDMVESCPEDDLHPYDSIVDREIIFNTNQFNNIGWNNFSVNDWKPSAMISSNDEVKKVLSHECPTWDILKIDEVEQLYVRKFFDILNKGKLNNSDPSKDFKSRVSKIDESLKKSEEQFPIDDDFKKQYEDFNSFFKLTDVNDKKYEYVLSYDKVEAGQTIPFTWMIENWTSNFAIFAPQYLEKHQYKPLDISKLLQKDEDYQKWIQDHSDILTERTRFISWMNSLSEEQIEQKISLWQETYKQNVIKVGGGTPFFILAAGITGDYVYPVVSIEKPIPNPDKECICFGNNCAYERVQIAFQGNQTEKYVVGKFYNKKNSEKILAQINEKCNDIMNWPENVQAAYMANDLSCTLNASAFRISYIPQLVEKVNLISYLLTLFILVVGLIISGIIVRRYVSSNRSTIGIMQANGIKKWSIAISLTPFAFIPSLLGGIAGYLLGTFLQSAAIGLFSSYWTLPTNLLAFSWPALLLSVCLPFLVFVLVSVFSTYIVLREKTTDLMKSGSEFKSNWLSRVIKKPFKKFTVLTKFRISIAFNSLWKLTILSIMSSLAMSSLVFGMTMNGKFDTAITKTSDTRDYSYAIDLYSPTTQGGQYIPISADGFGQTGFQKSAHNVGHNFLPSLFSSKKENWTWDNSWNGISSSEEQTKLFYKQYYDVSFELINLAHIQSNDWMYKSLSFDDSINSVSHQNMFIPFLSDSIGQKTDLQYLKNRVSSEMTMNYLIGISSFGLTSNPWDIASSLMPENSRNICNQKYQKIINEIGYNIYHSEDTINWNTQENKSFFTQISDESYEINQSNVVDFTGLGLNHDFVSLMVRAYSEKDSNGLLLIPSSGEDFAITYNSIPLSELEETYTYLTVDGVRNSGNSSLPKNQKIIGIDNNTSCIKLINDNGTNYINSLKYEGTPGINTIFPMVVNELVAKKYNVHSGSYMTFNVLNKADRYIQQIQGNSKQNEVTFKIVGVMKSRENEEYYIDQQVANYILGLKSTLANVDDLDESYINYNDAIRSTMTIDDGSRSKASLNDIRALKTNTGDDYNIVPYGFNGYFTKDPNGSKALTQGYSFYCPYGLYLPSSDLKSNSSSDVLKYGANFELANKITGLENTELGKKITNAYNLWDQNRTNEGFAEWKQFIDLNIDDFIDAVSRIWGNTTYISLVTNAVDKNSNDMVYKTMSNTISNIEIVVLVIIAFMVFFIVLLMSSIIIADSKKLAAILSSLGYTDMENALSFMSIYIPVIILGLLIAIPLTMGFTAMFQLAIMKGIGLLVDATTKWYFYLIGAGVVVFELVCSIVSSWISLRRGSLTQMIK